MKIARINCRCGNPYGYVLYNSVVCTECREKRKYKGEPTDHIFYPVGIIQKKCGLDPNCKSLIYGQKSGYHLTWCTNCGGVDFVSKNVWSPSVISPISSVIAEFIESII